MIFGKQKDEYTASAVNNPPPRRSEARPQDTCQLYHPASGQCWWLHEGENSIGRGFGNDIIIRDESVSRNHAKIWVDGANIYLEDCASANGVFVAGERVKSALLMRDAIFNLGLTELLIRKPTVLETGETDLWMHARS